VRQFRARLQEIGSKSWLNIQVQSRGFTFREKYYILYIFYKEKVRFTHYQIDVQPKRSGADLFHSDRVSGKGRLVPMAS